MNSFLPKVSVLMPIYNGELYIREAIDSILNQTFSDFELIAIDDCSTDRSVEIVRSYPDPRVKLVANPVNHGVRFIANQGHKLAQAEYIARMDCDDVCFPERLAKQVKYLDRHPEIAVVGSQIIDIDLDGKVINQPTRLRFPTEQSSMRWTASYQCPFANPTAMYRKQVVVAEVGGYDEQATFAEDYDLWLRLLQQNYQGANLDEVLLKYRINPKSMTNSASINTTLNASAPMAKRYFDDLIPGYDREKETIINFFLTLNPNLAAATNRAMDILRDRYLSLYLNGKMTKDLSINTAKERACMGYCLFSVDRWQATQLIFKAIWQYPGLLHELPMNKIIYLILFGRSGRRLFQKLFGRIKAKSHL